MQLKPTSSIAAVLKDPDATATTLITILMDRLGSDILNWDPATLEFEIMDTFGLREVPEVNLAKINAIITALTTNLFYVSVETFHHICNALNGSSAGFEYWDPVTAEEAAWAITEMELLDPTEEDGDPAENSFSHEVKGYLGAILAMEGIEPFGVFEVAELPPQQGSPDQFEDDPIMFSAINKHQMSNRQAIEEYIFGRVYQTAATLNQLPLQRADKSFLEKWLKEHQPLPD